MKRLVFVLLAIAAAVLVLPLFCGAQQSITYTIETTTRADSFFLVETISQASDAAPRASMQVNYYLLRDTAQLTNLQTRLIQEATDAEARAAEQTSKAMLARAQAASINSAAKQAFSPEKKAPQMPADKPPELKKTPPKKKKKH